MGRTVHRQIAELQKTMSSMDAGSGTDHGSPSGQNPRATSTTRLLAARARARRGPGPSDRATRRKTPRAGEAPKTDATVAMNTASQGRATSAQDVRSQQQGQPTSAQIAQGSAQPAGGSQPQADKMMQANAALDRARAADQKGDNAGCTQALGEAKQLVGNR